MTESIVARHFVPLVFAVLAIIIAILYFPVLGAYFIGDDFSWLRVLHFSFKSLLEGRDWNIWLTPFTSPGVWILFRPGLNLFYLLDYTAWELNPLGYHMTDLVLHILNTWLVFLIGWQLTYSRGIGVVAALLFATMPVHVETVAWFSARADGLGTLWYLIGVIFFILFRNRKDAKLLAISILAFSMGLLVKESNATLPVMLLLYDIFFHRTDAKDLRGLILRHLPFWLVLAAYFLVRILLIGPDESAILARARFLDSDWAALLQTYAALVADPVSQVSYAAGLLFLALLAFGVALYHARPQVWFGVLWLAITILPSFVNLEHALYDRFVYLPSVGLAILLAGLLPRAKSFRSSNAYGLGLFALMVIGAIYSAALYDRNEGWSRASVVSRLVPAEVHRLHPTLPSDARIVFTGLPPFTGPSGVQAFQYVAEAALQIEYDNPQLRALGMSSFPLWVDRLDHTYFFEYSRRKVTERTDLIKALEQRKRCEDFSTPSVTWEFTSAAQGWEPWHQLTDFQFREGSLMTRSTGGDPFMGSQMIDIPSMTIGDIEIVMRVVSDQPKLMGEVYWLGKNQQDFSPALKQSFEIQGDGAFHIYRLDIARSGQLLAEDHIVQLRLDPVDAPAQIAIKSIRVLVHCTLQEGSCRCSS